MTLLENPAGGMLTGRKAVTSAGTAEQIVTSVTSIISVAIQAETDNSAEIAVGDSNVVAADGTERGIILAAGESTTLAIGDLAIVWIDAKTNGDGVTYLCLKASS